MDKAELPLKVNHQEESFDPKGHPPLVFVERDLFRTPKGDVVKSEWPIGSESYHRELFIEYERTFGRGMAKDITHGLGFIPIPSDLKPKIKMLQKEYWEMAGRIRNLSLSGSEEIVRQEIQKIKEYRSKFPELYLDVKTDVDKPSTFNIRFEKKS